MNVYVETNFVLELVFQQEQAESCAMILERSAGSEIQLILPAYSLAEPHEKLGRQAFDRRELQKSLTREIRQLSRSITYTARLATIQDIAKLLITSNEEERVRFDEQRERILECAQIVPLTADILRDAAAAERTFGLTPQDAVVYASIISHLRESRPAQACFLNRNKKDFDTPDIVDELAQYNCRLIAHFDQGVRYIAASTSR